MDVAAHLPLPLLAHLKIVLGHRHILSTVEDWATLQLHLRTRPTDVLVVDPAGPGDVHVPEVLQIRERHPSIPIVVYTVLSPPSMRATLDLVRAGVQEVVLHRVEDEPRRFRTLLEGLQGYVLGDLLLQQISEPLARLPAATAHVVERLLRNPEEFRAVPDLATEAGVTLRMLYRQFDRAGLAAPGLVHDSSRLLRAFGYLLDPRCFLEDAAARLGYSEPRVLNRHFQAATGRTGGAVRDSMSPEAFVALLALRMRRNGETPPPPSP